MSSSSSSQYQSYQGYPYDNPATTEAPSVDPSTENRWDNLPRRPLRGLRGQDGKRKSEQSPSAKIDMEPHPVVYIDLSDLSSSSTTERTSPSSGSGTESRSASQESQRNYVQDTIFYNPFEDRMISRPFESPEEEITTVSETDPSTNVNEVERQALETAAESSTSPNLNPFRPSIPSKETQIYIPPPIPDDGFSLSPIPVEDFPEPPPAYTEIDRVRPSRPPLPARVSETVIDMPIPPPPTQVIINSAAMVEPIQPNPHRKILYCTRCGARVHTLVVKQTGAVTHAIACILLMFCLLPCICLTYCMDCCKYRNHYCPNCNHLIGYEVLYQKTVYAK